MWLTVFLKEKPEDSVAEHCVGVDEGPVDPADAEITTKERLCPPPIGSIRPRPFTKRIEKGAVTLSLSKRGVSFDTPLMTTPRFDKLSVTRLLVGTVKRSCRTGVAPAPGNIFSKKSRENNAEGLGPLPNGVVGAAGDRARPSCAIFLPDPDQ